MVSDLPDGDTIAAIATPPGRGGISIVRISGPDSGAILSEIFSGARDPKKHDRVMIYGHIIDGDRTIDEVLAVSMQAPHSYTGEDVAEIQSHGGYAAAETILTLAVKHGARLSAPGEFTKRAFLNGKLDLAQAEAVMEIVSAVSREHLTQAEHLFEGMLSKKIHTLLDTIRNILSHLEYEIDFSEENPDTGTGKVILTQLEDTALTIESLLESYSTARQIKDGLSVTLAGTVNAGKSSLFNAMLGKKRAIVNSRPGTTRDWLEARIDLDGHIINLIDTAGLRETDDEIESEGVSETKRLMDSADIVIKLHPPEHLPDQTETTSNNIQIDIISKADLLPEPSSHIPNSYIRVSSVTHNGLDTLMTHLTKTVSSLVKTGSNDTLILVDRHHTELAAAHTHISNARSAAPQWSEEVVSYELSEAAKHLSNILGENIDLDVLDRIFASFCIGK